MGNHPAIIPFCLTIISFFLFFLTFYATESDFLSSSLYGFSIAALCSSFSFWMDCCRNPLDIQHVNKRRNARSLHSQCPRDFTLRDKDSYFCTPNSSLPSFRTPIEKMSSFQTPKEEFTDCHTPPVSTPLEEVKIKPVRQSLPKLLDLNLTSTGLRKWALYFCIGSGFLSGLSFLATMCYLLFLCVAKF